VADLGTTEKPLDGTGEQLYEMTITIDGVVSDFDPMYSLAADGRTKHQMQSYMTIVPAAGEVVVHVKSPNVADIAVGVTVTLYDVSTAGSQMDLVDVPNATAVTAIKNAVLGATGVTAGGTYTLAKVLKILAAAASGDWKLKTGTTSTWQIKDPDDGATVVLEMKVAETDPPREVTVSV